MGLAGGVADLGLATRCGSGQNRGLRAGDGGLLQVDRRGTQAVGRLERMAFPFDIVHPHRAERLQVNRQRAASREISTRWRETRPPHPREERADQQNRSAEPANQVRIRALACDTPAPDSHLGRPNPLHFGTQASEQLAHHGDILDPRHVRQRARLIGQQAGREQRQRGVLVALDVDRAGQAVPALDDECRGGLLQQARGSPRRRSDHVVRIPSESNRPSRTTSSRSVTPYRSTTTVCT